MNDSTNCDLLISGGIVLTVDAQRRIYWDGAIAVAGNRIVEVGRREDVEPKYWATRRVDARGKVVTPGLIQTHVHVSAEQCVKGVLPDTMPPSQWVRQVTQFYAATSAEEEALNATFTFMELIRTGTTCFIEAGTTKHTPEIVDAIGGRENFQEENSTCWRRPFRNQHREAVARNQRWNRERDSDQAEPDWQRDRDDRCHRTGAQGRLQLHYFAPLRRNRRHLHRGSGGGNSGWADQDWFRFAHRPHREIQSAVAHRGRVGCSGAFSGENDFFLGLKVGIREIPRFACLRRQSRKDEWGIHKIEQVNSSH